MCFVFLSVCPSRNRIACFGHQKSSSTLPRIFRQVPSRKEAKEQTSDKCNSNSNISNSNNNNSCDNNCPCSPLSNCYHWTGDWAALASALVAIPGVAVLPRTTSLEVETNQKSKFTNYYCFINITLINTIYKTEILYNYYNINKHYLQTCWIIILTERKKSRFWEEASFQ